MKMLKFQPRLALVTNTFAAGWVDLTHFFAVFMMFLTMMAVAAHVQFGSSVEEVGPGRERDRERERERETLPRV